jgi:hypothetical protein
MRLHHQLFGIAAVTAKWLDGVGWQWSHTGKSERVVPNHALTLVWRGFCCGGHHRGYGSRHCVCNRRQEGPQVHRQSFHHLQGEQGEPQEKREIIGQEREESDQNPCYRLG